MSATFRARWTALLVVWFVWFARFNRVDADGQKPSAPIVIQGLAPRGLRISVPETPGTDVVIINANINFPILQKETGQVSGSVLEPSGGYWILEKKDVALKAGDVVFYWIYTAIGEKGHRVGGNQVIHELVDEGCRPSPTTVNGKTTCAGQLIFNEDFDTFNTSIWKHSIQFSDDPDLDFSTYTNDPVNSFVKDGSLHLKATVLDVDDLVKATKLEGCTWTRGGTEYCERKPMGWDILPPTHSALLTTKGTFSFKYGRIDIRAKAAAGDWLMSRLLLEPQKNVYGKNPFESGRVEMLRSRGNEGASEPSGWELGSRLNDPQYDIATCHRVLYIYKHCHIQPGKLHSGDMHVFSVKWSPFFISTTIDGGCEHKVSPPEGGFLRHGYFKDDCQNSPWERGTFMAPFDQEFYIQISLLVGGLHTYKEEFTSRGYLKPWTDDDPRAMLKFWKNRGVWLPTWSSDMEVDYVKVWAL